MTPNERITAAAWRAVLNQLNGLPARPGWQATGCGRIPPGGTTGQTLAKVSGAGFNLVWVDP